MTLESLAKSPMGKMLLKQIFSEKNSIAISEWAVQKLSEYEEKEEGDIIITARLTKCRTDIAVTVYRQQDGKNTPVKEYTKADLPTLFNLILNQSKDGE